MNVDATGSNEGSGMEHGEKKAGKWRIINSVLLVLVLALQAVIIYQLYSRHAADKKAIEAFEPEQPADLQESPAPMLAVPPAPPTAKNQMRSHPRMIMPPMFGPSDMDEYMNNMFEQVSQEFGQMQKMMDSGPGWDSLMLSPAMDMREQGDSYVLSFSLPGMNASNVEINLNGRMLTISSHHEETDGENMRGFSHFDRKVLLPGPVADSKSATATYTNGMLRIVVPKDKGRSGKEEEITQEEVAGGRGALKLAPMH